MLQPGLHGLPMALFLIAHLSSSSESPAVCFSVCSMVFASRLPVFPGPLALRADPAHHRPVASLFALFPQVIPALAAPGQILPLKCCAWPRGGQGLCPLSLRPMLDTQSAFNGHNPSLQMTLGKMSSSSSQEQALTYDLSSEKGQ